MGEDLSALELTRERKLSPASGIHVWPESPRALGEEVEISATLERPGTRGTPIWFRIPSQHLDDLTESADPFVLASLFVAMRLGHSLHVHGRASLTLLRNLEEFQRAWARWLPDRYRVVELSADEEVDAGRPASDGALLAFSGGLDSCFSARRHVRGECGRATRRIEAGVMVHGFDIPLDRPDCFDRAAENSRRILDSLGLRLITMATNARDVGDEVHAWWVDAHAALIAACLHLLGRDRATGLIAGSHAVDGLRLPWGSNPITDPMLSSDSFSIVNDGGAYARVDKPRGIADWPEAMRRLRPCFEGPEWDRNCGECPTCVLTALSFVAHAIPKPESIPIESFEGAVEGLAGTDMDPPLLTRFEEVAAVARASGIEDPWVGAMARLVRDRRRGSSWLRRALPSRGST